MVHDSVLMEDREAFEERLHISDRLSGVILFLNQLEGVSFDPIHDEHHLVCEEDRLSGGRKHLVAFQQLHVEQLLRRVVEPIVREINFDGHSDGGVRLRLCIIDCSVPAPCHLVLDGVLFFEWSEPHRFIHVVASHLRLVRSDGFYISKREVSFAVPGPDAGSVLALGPFEMFCFSYHLSAHPDPRK